MSRRIRIVLLLTGAVIALLSLVLLIFTLAPQDSSTVERTRIAPTVFVAP